jgi:purine-nucleoside phosphorylase
MTVIAPENTLSALEKACAAIRTRYRGPRPKIGIVLGSGLGGAVPSLQNESVIDYERLPGFPKPTVQGHCGKLALGMHAGLPVAVLQGRFHYYEGHPMPVVTLPIRLLKSLGVETVLLTSAVGSVNPRIRPGDFVFLRDHINLMGTNPLVGQYHPEFGTMFPDMSEVYDRDLRRAGLRVAKRLGFRATEGVYVAVCGPSYETPAEIEAFHRLGADVVGMSMVPEAIVARQGGMRIFGLSWTANFAAGLSDAPLRHPDVLRLGQVIAGKMLRFVEEFLKHLSHADAGSHRKEEVGSQAHA